MSIRTKLFLAIFLTVLISLLVMGTAHMLASRGILERAIREHLISVADLQSARLSELVEKNRERVALVTSRTQLRLSLAEHLKSGEPTHLDKVTKVLVDARDSIPDFEEIQIVSLQGRVLASTDPEAVGMDYSDKSYFQAGRSAITAGNIDLLRGERKLYIGGPLVLDDETLGILIVRASITHLDKIATDHIGEGQTGETMVADLIDGKPVSIIPLRFHQGAVLPEIRIDPFDGRWDPGSIARRTDYRGAEVLAIRKLVDGTDWGVVVKIDEREAMAPVSHLVAVLIVSALASLPVAFLLAYVLSKLLLRRLLILTKMTKMVADGNVPAKVELPDGADEIGVLTTSFRKMVNAINHREQMLKDSRLQISSIVDAAADAILSMDSSGCIESANPAAAALFHAEDRNLVGRNISEFLDLPVPRAGESGLEAFLHRPPDANQNGEITARRIDGDEFPVKLSLGKVGLQDRAIYTAIVIDQTEAKKMDRMKNEFVSTVSHELRTPLTSIKGSLGLLRASVLGDVSAQARSMIDIAYNNCDRLVRLINDILDIEKIEAGKQSFEFEPVSIAQQFNRVIADTAGFASGMGVTVVATKVPEDLKVEADPDRLIQVLTNLVSNAVKFSPKGETVILSAIVVDGSRIRVSVTDHGPGVPKKFRSRIFQKFAQNDSSDTRKVGGTGLGLSTSKAIIEAHGGEIGFDSTKGEGTTFWYELPKLNETEAQELVVTGGARPKVLICEDDADIARLLQIIVSEFGFDTEVCQTAAEAESRLRAGGFAAMTVDIGLPDRDGMGLIHDLRKDAELQNIPIIVVSASAPEPNAELFGDAFKVFDWLKKPIDVGRLRSALRRAVSGTDDQPLHILHVDDDPEHVAIVAQVIDGVGSCDIAQTCAEARQRLRSKDYDLVILDLILPDGRGESLIPDINANGAIPPQILVFSIREPDKEFLQKVDGVLVKSRTSNARLKEQLESLLRNEPNLRDVETFH